MSTNITKDYVWNTLGVFLQNAISPLLLIVITRINGIDASGVFSYAFSVAIIFWAIGMWGGRTYQVSDAKKLFKQQSYIIVRLILALVMFGGALIFSALNHYDATKTSIIMALVMMKIFESIADAIYGVMQINDHLFIAGKSLTFKAVAGMVIFIVINLTTHNIFMSSMGLVLVNALVIVVYDIPQARRLQAVWVSSGEINQSVRESFQIMRRTSVVFIVSFLSAFSLNIPRYFIDKYHENQIGYFGIIAMPITLIVLFMTFILQPNIVNLSRQLYRKEYDRFSYTVRTILLITIGVGAAVLGGVYLFGTQLLQLIFGVSFSDYKMSLIIITGGAVVSALVAVYINILTIMRRFKAQIYTLLTTNIVLAAVCVPFVRTHGLLGGASMFAVTNVLQFSLLSLAYSKHIRRLSGAKKD